MLALAIEFISTCKMQTERTTLRHTYIYKYINIARHSAIYDSVKENLRNRREQEKKTVLSFIKMHSSRLLFSLIWMFLLKSAHNESTYVLSRLPFVCLILAETETDPDIRNDHKRIPCRSTAMRWIYVDVASIGVCVCVCLFGKMVWHSTIPMGTTIAMPKCATQKE